MASERKDQDFARADARQDSISREEAVRLLGVKKETLYTYVSRGWIRSFPLDGGREHVFSRADVERQRARSRARAGEGAVAEGAMRFGEPIIATRITEITAEGPRYRGKLATDLATRGISFETVALWLWVGVWQEGAAWEDVPAFEPPHENVLSGSPSTDVIKRMARIVLELGAHAAGEQSSLPETLAAGRRIVQALVGTIGYITPQNRYSRMHGGERLAAAVLRILGGRATPDMVAAIDAMMVLCADYELTPTSFAARVVASAGADLYASIAAGLCAHSGVYTGQICDPLAELMTADAKGDELGRHLRSFGTSVYGFNHALARGADPRAAWMIERARTLSRRNPSRATARMMSFLARLEADFGLHPGLPAGIVVLTSALGLPTRSATAIWGIARTAGQIANVIEQRAAGFILRPRATFVGS